MLRKREPFARPFLDHGSGFQELIMTDSNPITETMSGIHAKGYSSVVVLFVIGAISLGVLLYNVYLTWESARSRAAFCCSDNPQSKADEAKRLVRSMFQFLSTISVAANRLRQWDDRALLFACDRAANGSRWVMDRVSEESVFSHLARCH